MGYTTKKMTREEEKISIQKNSNLEEILINMSL